MTKPRRGSPAAGLRALRLCVTAAMAVCALPACGAAEPAVCASGRDGAPAATARVVAAPVPVAGAGEGYRALAGAGHPDHLGLVVADDDETAGGAWGRWQLLAAAEDCGPVHLCHLLVHLPVGAASAVTGGADRQD